MTDDTRDTDPSPHPPEEETLPMPKPDRSAMTSDQKLDAILDRLEEGDRRFDMLEADLSIAFNWMREISLTRGRDDVVAEIDRHLETKTQANGHGRSDETTQVDPK